jgi:hypothetical protein
MNLVLVKIWKKINNDKKEKGGGSKEGGGVFMSKTNYQRIENKWWAW